MYARHVVSRCIYRAVEVRCVMGCEPIIILPCMLSALIHHMHISIAYLVKVCDVQFELVTNALMN